MELVVRKNDLLRELQLFQGIVERKNTIPILANVLMEAKGDSVSFLATADATDSAQLAGTAVRRMLNNENGPMTRKDTRCSLNDARYGLGPFSIAPVASAAELRAPLSASREAPAKFKPVSYNKAILP